MNIKELKNYIAEDVLSHHLSEIVEEWGEGYDDDTSKPIPKIRKLAIKLDQSGEYSKEVVISFFGDKMKSIRDVQEGSDVNVSINLSSREFNGKYYHTIDGWFLAVTGKETVGKTNKDLPF